MKHPRKIRNNKEFPNSVYLICFVIIATLLNYANSNLVVNIDQTSAIVDSQNKISITIATITSISNNLKITIDNVFSVVLDDGNATDNKLSPCYLSGLPIVCTVTTEGSKHALTFTNSLFQANKNYQLGLLVINPSYSDNFVLDAYKGTQKFITFGTIAIDPQTIICSVSMASNVVRARADATFTMQVIKTPPAGSQLFINVPVPASTFGFPKMIANSPFCSNQNSEKTYSCSLSQLFSQQILTVNGLFPATQTSVKVKISSLYNPPYNGSWLQIKIKINDNFGRQMKECQFYQPPPTTLPTSLSYIQSGWNNNTGANSTVIHSLRTYFTPLSSSTVLMIYPNALTVSTNPPAQSVFEIFNSSYTSLKISNMTTTTNSFQISSTIRNPLSTIPLGLQMFVLFNDTNFMEKYSYPATNMALQYSQHTVFLVSSSNRTGFTNKLNISIVLGVSGGLGTIGQAITVIVSIQLGKIVCDSSNAFAGLQMETNIPNFMIKSCNETKISISSTTVITLSTLWILFKYQNHYSIAPNQVFAQVNTISGYKVSAGGKTLTLEPYTCDVSLKNTVLQLGATNKLELRQNLISNLDLSNSRRIVKLVPPLNLRPLSLGIQVFGSQNKNTSIVSYNIAVESIEAQFRQSCNIDISGILNPIDFTELSRQWSLTFTDKDQYLSSTCSVSTLPQYSSAKLLATYSLSNTTIQQPSVLNMLIESVLKYQMNSAVIPIVQLSMNPASVSEVDSSQCGIPGENTKCNRVTSYVVNSTFGGLQTNITLTIANSPQPINNTFVIKIMNSLTGFVYQTNTIVYTLVPRRFTYTVAFTGLYLEVGQLQINITQKPNRPISLNYSGSDVLQLFSDPQCSLCGDQGDRIIIKGTVKYFYRSNVRVFGIGTNGAIYAQSSIQIKYPCPWIGCRICQNEDLFDPITNETIQGDLVCLKCFDSQLTKYSLLYKSQCFQNCPVGTFNATVKCEPCAQLCYACSQQSCNQCQPGYFVYQNNCIQVCPQGYVKNSTHCIPRKIICPQNCLDCPDDNICNECNSNYYLLTNKCYAQCPQGYVVDPFSNQTAKCTQFIPPDEAGFFPFIFMIILLIWLLILGVFKCFEKRSLLLGNFVALSAILEWGPLLICIISSLTKYDPLSRTNTAELTLLSQALCFIIFFSKILINLIFFVYFMKNIADDNQFVTWKDRSTVNRNLYITLMVLSCIFSFQSLRVVYSRLFGLQIFYGRFNTSLIFKPINFFTLGYFLLVSLCIYIFAAVAIYNEDGFKTTLFYASIQLVIVQTMYIVTAAMDAKCGKAEQFFQYQVYKIDNIKEQVYADSYATPGKKKGIDIYYQNQSGGSLHQILRSDRKRNFFQRPSEVKAQWVQTNKIPRRHDTLKQESSASRLDTEQEQEKRTSLFKWKIIKDWNKLKESIPTTYNPRVLMNIKTIERNKYLSKSPGSKSSARKSIKKVASFQDLKTAQIVNPLGFFLQNQSQGVLRGKYPVQNQGKGYFYKINQNAQKDQQINQLDDSQSDNREAKTAPEKRKRGIGKIVNNLKMQKQINLNDQDNISEIQQKNVFQNENENSVDQNSLYQIQSDLIHNLRPKEEKRDRYHQQQQLKLDQDQFNSQAKINIPELVQQKKQTQKQQDFDQIAKKRIRKFREPKNSVNRQTQGVYLQRLLSSDAFETRKKKRPVPINKKDRANRQQLEF